MKAATKQQMSLSEGVVVRGSLVSVTAHVCTGRLQSSCTCQQVHQPACFALNLAGCHFARDLCTSELGSAGEHFKV